MLIDCIFVVLVLLAIFKGISKGFIFSLFSFFAFFIGISVALRFSVFVSTYISAQTGFFGKWLPFLSYLLVFLGVVFLVNIAGRLFQKTAEIITLGWLNKLLGVCLYLLLYALIFSVFLFYLTQLNIIHPKTTQESKVYSFIFPIAPKIIQSIGTIIPFFKDIFAQLELFFENVSNKMSH